MRAFFTLEIVAPDDVDLTPEVVAEALASASRFVRRQRNVPRVLAGPVDHRIGFSFSKERR